MRNKHPAGRVTVVEREAAAHADFPLEPDPPVWQAEDMNESAQVRIRSAVPALFALLFLVSTGACQPAPFQGTYRDRSGLTEYRFAADGEVALTVLGNEHLASYDVDGDRILLHGANGTLVLRRIEGDRLAGPMGLLLVRSEASE